MPGAPVAAVAAKQAQVQAQAAAVAASQAAARLPLRQRSRADLEKEIRSNQARSSRAGPHATATAAR